MKMKHKKCRICSLSKDDVLYPENFVLNDDGVCFQCWMEQNQVIPDYRDSLQRYLDNLM